MRRREEEGGGGRGVRRGVDKGVRETLDVALIISKCRKRERKRDGGGGGRGRGEMRKMEGDVEEGGEG